MLDQKLLTQSLLRYLYFLKKLKLKIKGFVRNRSFLPLIFIKISDNEIESYSDNGNTAEYNEKYRPHGKRLFDVLVTADIADLVPVLVLVVFNVNKTEIAFSVFVIVRML